ncbi:MAG: helix-turn-helix domain-containing protein [Bryobacterales bacterium]|nr:helix-turn-helix domain-containing protein [Bryobacterales bacterium]
MQKQTVSVEEFAAVMGIGRNLAYRSVERGDVRAVKIGKRIVIPRAEVERLLNGAQSQNNAA